MSIDKKIVIVAGPNGAGKTTFAREFLPHEARCPLFVNADLIAAGLSPFDPDSAAFRAGRVMLAEIAAHVEAGHNFAFETTLSGLTYSTMIPKWRASGYKVKLLYLACKRRGGDCPRCDAGAPGWARYSNRCDPPQVREQPEELSGLVSATRRLLAVV